MVKENSLRVRLEEPEYFRKDILESAELAAFNLKCFNNFKVLAEVKNELTGKLITVLREVHKDLNKVKRDMPEVEIPEVHSKKVSGIDSELEEIRERLKRLHV